MLSFAAVCACTIAVSASAGEILYNGIELPTPWPPRLKQITREPMRAPYLEHPPAIIPIDVGRQLFVDDFLIAETTLKRTLHRAKYHPANPLVKPEKPWERTGGYPTAMAFSDGVWYDPANKLFKMWYMAGYPINGTTTTAYAQSADGVHWEKPNLDVVPNTNIVIKGVRRDSTTVWFDQQAADPARRFSMICYNVDKTGSNEIRFSKDGIHWGEVAATKNAGDRSTFFYNPFRNVWVLSLRSDVKGKSRVRAYAEGATLTDAAKSPALLWVGADRLDPHNPNPAFRKIEPELYNLDAVAYESLMLGLFSIWEGDPSPASQKRNEVLLGFSRDGFHWHRPDRVPFAGVNETKGAWNWANVQSVGGGCLIVGDKLFFYVSGREKECKIGRASTGLAVLRRDGFASMDADAEGTLTTRPVRFAGKRLFVNVAADKGEFQAEIVDQQGKVIEPFTKENCEPIVTDKTRREVRWKDVEDLSAVSGKPVRFRFYLKNGSLFAFWVSPNASGASHGYVAAGGPGFTGPTDTVGKQD